MNWYRKKIFYIRD